MKRAFKKVIFAFLILFFVLVLYFFVGKAPKAKDIGWGVTFSQKYAVQFGLDWKEAYLAVLDDLRVTNLRTIIYWDLFEPEPSEYVFEDIDWQLQEAQKRGVKVILAMGMKTPRWPECNIPDWAKKLDKKSQQEKILEMIEVIVLKYKDSLAIEYWQIENEPFLVFGECPWYDKEFFKREVALVRLLDYRGKPILITESGELSTWFSSARIADVVGVTMYRQTWWHKAGGFYAKYFLPPVHYWRKAQLVKNFFGKEVIVVELQAEAWGPLPLYSLPIETQIEIMDVKDFRNNIKFAKRSGLDTFYLWGSEWWYYLKFKHNSPEIWEEAKKLWQ
ncbi:MAG: beta-galactosidase [Patescibacteria group bacterium]